MGAEELAGGRRRLVVLMCRQGSCVAAAGPKPRLLLSLASWYLYFSLVYVCCVSRYARLAEGYTNTLGDTQGILSRKPYVHTLLYTATSCWCWTDLVGQNTTANMIILTWCHNILYIFRLFSKFIFVLY